jgi:hypothetical protein
LTEKHSPATSVLPPDGVKGGKYLLVPWHYKGPSPSEHYVYRSWTDNVLVFYRAFFLRPKDLAPPNGLIAGTRTYPFGKQSTAAAMKFPDGSTNPA